MEGTTYGGTSWVQNDHYADSFDDIAWTQFSGGGTVTAGTGITVDGLEVSIDRTSVDTWYDAAGAAAQAGLRKDRASACSLGTWPIQQECLINRHGKLDTTSS
jgi:hypothetical protein